MSNLSEIVDSLENKVVKLLQEHENLKRLKVKLDEEITILKSKQDRYLKDIDAWKDECNTLKIANSMLGSEQPQTRNKTQNK